MRHPNRMGEAWVPAGWVAGGMAYAWLAIRAAVAHTYEGKSSSEVDREKVVDPCEPPKRSA